MAEPLKASRTAVQVCQGRAAADGRLAVGRFADPTAWVLLRPDEREPVQWVRDGAVPRPWAQRIDYETVLGTSELMAARTVAIDDAVRACEAPQVVILGAGLDGRAWRLLSGRAVYEVDQPASQEDKRRRCAPLEGEPPVFVPVDFRADRLDAALAAAGHRPELATVWVWEGVVPYLTPAQVEATVGVIAGCSAAGSRLVVNFQTPGRGMALGRLVARAVARSTGRASVWRDEPWRSTWTPTEMASLLSRHGFGAVADIDLVEVAAELGLVVRRELSLRHSPVMIADRG
ncbi:class I SAM-dependent methyltransferase [Cryptosporangium sp. NPDC051539]|uniref:class I SAM-dependent methyltransferase n=1 Tax=Cryptosporangium sp. NPDC051539 TaxID=3363962 RepID=UPI0037B837C7